MSDYVITIDENGQPIISHALWTHKNQNGSKKDFKYYQKIKEGLKTRYFYSKEEWDAYQRAKSEPTKSSLTPETRSSGVRNRPTGRKKNITGTSSGTADIHGEGLGTGPVGKNDAGFKTKKQKELAEAVVSLNDYKQKQAETKRARKATRENLVEYAKGVGTTALGLALGSSNIARQGLYYTATSKKDLKASVNAKREAAKEQRKAAGRFLKETGDFASEVMKDSVKSKKDQMREDFEKRKGNLGKSVADAVGITKRDEVSNAQSDAFDKQMKYAIKDYNKDIKIKESIKNRNRFKKPDDIDIHEQQIQMAMVDDILADLAKAKKDRDEAVAYAEKLMKEYRKTPLGVLEYSANSINSLLGKIFNGKK